jgi:hypothetical protein
MNISFALYSVPLDLSNDPKRIRNKFWALIDVIHGKSPN